MQAQDTTPWSTVSFKKDLYTFIMRCSSDLASLLLSLSHPGDFLRVIPQGTY